MPLAVEVENVAEELQIVLVQLQCDTILKQKYVEVGIPETRILHISFTKKVSEPTPLLQGFLHCLEEHM